MIESPIPQDILKYKTKFVGNLSMRESICGALGIGFGLATYFLWTKNIEQQDLRTFISALVVLPFFLIGFMKLYDQPFEKLAGVIILDNFIAPLKRKKEVHFPEWEKYEKTLSFMVKKDKAVDAEAEESEDASPKKKKKKKQKPKEEKVKIIASTEYEGIK